MIGISAACFCGWEEMTMEYKEKIIEMVNEIDRKDILRYIYIIISDIMKEEKEREKNDKRSQQDKIRLRTAHPSHKGSNYVSARNRA